MMVSPFRDLASPKTSSDEEEGSQSPGRLEGCSVLQIDDSSGDEYIDSAGGEADRKASSPTCDLPKTEASCSDAVATDLASSKCPTSPRASPDLGVPDLQSHWNLQDVARQRKRANERCDYYLTAQGHPFGPFFLYPSALPLFEGRGGRTLIGAVCAGLSSVISSYESNCLDLSLSPAALWQILLTKGPSKSFGFSMYLLNFIRFCIGRMIELGFDSGSAALQLQQMAQSLYGEDFRICLLMGGESYLSTGVAPHFLNFNSKLMGRNLWGLNCEIGLFRGLMGDLPGRPTVGCKTIIIGDAMVDSFRPIVGNTVAIVSRRLCALTEVVVWVLDQVVPSSAKKYSDLAR